MRWRQTWLSTIAVCLPVACATAHKPSLPAPLPVPTEPVTNLPPPSVDSAKRGPWRFTYTPGEASYVVTRSATTQRIDSTSTQHEESGNAVHETLKFEAGAQATNIIALVDSFTSTVPDPTIQTGLTDLPVQISAVFTDNVLTISSDSNSKKCSPVRSRLITDLNNLVIPFPDSLTPGLNWKDSVNLSGCQAGIPTASQVTRSFTVASETMFEGRRVLEVVRADSAHVNGEGGLQQHRVSIHAVGSGTGAYYLDIGTGQVVNLTTDQTLNIEIITILGKSQFLQRSKQDFVLTH